MPSGSSRPKPAPGVSVAALLSDPDLHRVLANMVRRKVPAADADDVVQATLADALSAVRVPEDETEVRRWVFGIARNKIADYYRAGRREVPHEEPDLDQSAEALPSSSLAGCEPHSARDLLRWAEGVLPPNAAAQQTFDWMLREGQGEKLESIAAEAKLPAPQVRKRVSRLRQHLKEKWVLELAAVAVLGIAVLVAVRILRRGPAIDLGPDRAAAPSERERALELRRVALDACVEGDFQRCLQGLDRAAVIDPAGDQTDEIRRAREIARAALQPSEAMPAGKGPITPNVRPTGTFDGTPPAPAPSNTRFPRAKSGTSESIGDSTNAPPAKGKALPPSKAPIPAPSSNAPDGKRRLKGAGSFVTSPELSSEAVQHQASHAPSAAGYPTLPFPQPEPNYAPRTEAPVQQAPIQQGPTRNAPPQAAPKSDDPKDVTTPVPGAVVGGPGTLRSESSKGSSAGKKAFPQAAVQGK